ncbi:MAG: acyl-ACP--UDP-N-acetylglucosamine O-acyltransferase [Candidatus Krumholzibacteria bacterium]|nr:acyl-ACP--UDP-N-acetylglucosamine O-acyltransferase [Candidatus Krumholzibacteria bacterium]
MPADIHDTAIIHPNAKIGDGTSIGPYSIIGEHVKLGSNCRIGSSVLIEGHTALGENNRVFHGAAIGTIPQDLKYGGALSYVKIGDNNVMREYVTINCATDEGESTLIGNENLLMAYVHVAHNCLLGDHVILANSVNLAGHVNIQDYAIIGGVVPVHQFVTVGAHSFIGGGSRIPKDIPPFVKVAGNPPRISGINAVGLQRRGFTSEQISQIKQAYKYLYRSGLNVTQALELIEKELPRTPEVMMFVDFINESRRGITK